MGPIDTSQTTPALKKRLERLASDIGTQSQILLTSAGHEELNAELAGSIGIALRRIAETRESVLAMASEGAAGFRELVSLLRVTGNRVIRWLNEPSPPVAQLPLIKVLEILRTAVFEMERLTAQEQRSTTRAIIVSTEFTRHLHTILFPAERMVVIAGRRLGDMARVTASFEVTGQRSSGHVEADQALLHRALMSMEASGAFATLWAHSHPGKGPWTVQPSTLDLQQQKDWSPHYSPALTGMVMSEDGYFRLFGDAYESGAVSVEFEGEGVTRVQEVHEHVFRIA